MPVLASSGVEGAALPFFTRRRGADSIPVGESEAACNDADELEAALLFDDDDADASSLPSVTNWMSVEERRLC